jgi:phosphate transport system substrate-binding protein
MWAGSHPVEQISDGVHRPFTGVPGGGYLGSLASPAVTIYSKTRAVPLLVAALAGSLALAACGASNENNSNGSGGSAAGTSAEQLSGTLNGAGSSAQQAAMQGWTAGFSGQQSGVTVNYDPIGSGGGRTQFLSGGVDFAGSDAALKDDEVKQAQTACGSGGYFELPNYISAIAVIYNLQGVNDLQLSPSTLAKIFAGTVKTWNDPAIAADNPGKSLPSTAIAPVHRADKSGTTANFTDYLNKAAGDVWTTASTDTWPAKGGEAANQTSGMVAAVKAGNGTIGYADESQAQGLQIAKIKVGGSYVAPSSEGAAKLAAGSPTVSGRAATDLAVQLNRTTTSSDEYPLVLVSYHIGCLQPKDATKGAILAAFEDYVISKDGQEAAAKAAGSAPISDDQRSRSQKVVDQIKG